MEAEMKTISSSVPSSPLDDAAGAKIAPDSSSPSLFRSVFPPASTVLGKDSSDRADIFGSLRNLEGGKWMPDNTSAPEKKKKEAEIDACLFGMSIFYGGKDDCAIPPGHPDTRYQYKKEDADASVSSDAISGEWWQGSFYY